MSLICFSVTASMARNDVHYASCLPKMGAVRENLPIE